MNEVNKEQIQLNKTRLINKEINKELIVAENYGGQDRRGQDPAIARFVGKLEVFMSESKVARESLQSELTSELKVLTTQLTSIDEKLIIQVKKLEEDIHQLEEKSNLLVDGHQQTNSVEHKGLILGMNRITKTVLTKTELIYKRIAHLEIKLDDQISVATDEVDMLKARLEVIEQKSDKAKVKLINDLGSTIKKGFFIGIAGGVVGFAVWLVSAWIGQKGL